MLGFYSSAARFALAGLFLFWLALLSLNSTIGRTFLPTLPVISGCRSTGKRGLS